MAKRIPKETICSFCLRSLLDKDSYSVKVKMYNSDPLDTNVYYTPSCEKCIKSDRVIEIRTNPKIKKK